MDGLTVAALFVIGLLVFGLLALTFGADTRDGMTDDHRAHVHPAA